MRLTIIFLLLFSLSTSSFGQTGDTLYVGKLASAQDDSSFVEAYVSAMGFYARKNIDSVRVYYKKGLAYCDKHNYKLGRAHLYLKLAIIDESLGLVQIAREHMEEALKIFTDEKNVVGMADVVGNIGAMEAEQGHYDEATKMLIRSIKLEDSANNKLGQLIGLMNVGSILLEVGDTTNATKFLNQAADIAKEIPLSDKVIALYNTIGVLYAVKGQTDLALQTFLQNLEMSNRPSFVGSHVECLSYLGEFYLEAQQPSVAIGYLEKGMEIAAQNHLTELRSNLLLETAVVVEPTDLPKAMRYYQEALDIAKQLGNKSFMVRVYKNQAAAFKRSGKYKEALEATELQQKITDSIFTSNKRLEISGITGAYELEKSNSKVKELEVQTMKRTTQRNLFLGIAIGVFIIMVVLFVFSRKMLLLNKELKKREAALQELNAMKGKLFSIIGHDLKGPVARIPTLLDIYEDKDTTADEKDFLLENLRSHTTELLDMLEKLLLWGQSLVKGIMMQKEQVSVSTHVHKDIALKKLSLQEKNITVLVNVDEGVQVLADPTHFDFIIRNLITNAVKYTRDGGQIVISSDSTARIGNVVISVKDNGVGIPPEVFPRIFSPVSSTPGTANEQGTGIGLMLCKEFAAINEGEIWVESELGKGATFYLMLKAVS